MQSIRINGKSAVNILDIQSLPLIPITSPAPFANVDMTKRIDVLQHEHAYVETDRTKFQPYLSTQSLNTCMFVMFYTQSSEVDKRYSLHIDNLEGLNIEEPILRLQSKIINIEIIGATGLTATSTTVLKKLIHALSYLAQKHQLEFVITRQRIGQHMYLTSAYDIYYESEYALEKAMLLYDELFNKTLPDELQTLHFNPSWRSEVSSIPGFNRLLPTLKEKLNKLNDHTISANQLTTEHQDIIDEILPYTNYFEANEYNALHFMSFLLNAGRNLQDVNQKILIQMFASSEQAFKENYQKLFTKKGAEASRLFHIINRNFNHTLTDFVYDLASGKLIPLSSQFFATPNKQIRLARLVNQAQHDYYFCYDSALGNSYQPIPSFNPDFYNALLNIAKKYFNQNIATRISISDVAKELRCGNINANQERVLIALLKSISKPDPEWQSISFILDKAHNYEEDVKQQSTVDNLNATLQTSFIAKKRAEFKKDYIVDAVSLPLPTIKLMQVRQLLFTHNISCRETIFSNNHDRSLVIEDINNATVAECVRKIK